MSEQPQHNLAMDLVRATEAAALAAARWMGRGKKEAGDQAAVDALRLILNTVDMDGVIVVGEGEKDKAPMLYVGERVGSGRGPAVDVAVDPVEGTRILAEGGGGSLAAVGVAGRGTMFQGGASYYMDKLVVGREARGKVSITAPVADNLQAIAEATGRPVNELTVIVLDRPRHQRLIEEIRQAGARVRLIRDGDVAAGLQAALPDSGIDALMGIGGTPEGVLTACAVKALGGEIQARLAPQSDEERERVLAAGLDLDRVLFTEDLVASDDAFFAATGITDGALLRGVRYQAGGAVTYALVARARTGTLRFIEAHHRWETLLSISQVPYA